MRSDVDIDSLDNDSQRLTVLQKILLDRFIPKWFVIVLAVIILFFSGLFTFLEFILVYVVFKYFHWLGSQLYLKN